MFGPMFTCSALQFSDFVADSLCCIDNPLAYMCCDISILDSLILKICMLTYNVFIRIVSEMHDNR